MIFIDVEVIKNDVKSSGGWKCSEVVGKIFQVGSRMIGCIGNESKLIYY